MPKQKTLDEQVTATMISSSGLLCSSSWEISKLTYQGVVLVILCHFSTTGVAIFLRAISACPREELREIVEKKHTICQ